MIIDRKKVIIINSLSAALLSLSGISWEIGWKERFIYFLFFFLLFVFLIIHFTLGVPVVVFYCKNNSCSCSSVHGVCCQSFSFKSKVKLSKIKTKKTLLFLLSIFCINFKRLAKISQSKKNDLTSFSLSFFDQRDKNKFDLGTNKFDLGNSLKVSDGETATEAILCIYEIKFRYFSIL